jgi:hypothetical protein
VNLQFREIKAGYVVNVPVLRESGIAVRRLDFERSSLNIFITVRKLALRCSRTERFFDTDIAGKFDGRLSVIIIIAQKA